MERQDEELVKKLMDEDKELRDAYKIHKDYERKIEKLEKKAHLSPEELVEKNRLKKLKLATKDELERILAKYRQ